jgi:membrane associated rhomboid family serine protease
MPKCVDCGKETPRDDMRGAPDDLRCLACVQNRYPIYDPQPRGAEPSKYPPVTAALVVGAFGCTLLDFLNARLASELIAIPYYVWNGQFWRLATTTLVHADPIHLLLNLCVIWIYGKVVETWMGSLLFGGFVLLTAAGPMGAEIMISRHSAVGLSGVGFALGGLLFALRKDKDFAAAIMQPQVVRWMFGAFFLFIVLTYFHIMNIANVAHAGGIVLGWLLGQAVLASRPRTGITAVCVLALVMTVCGAYMPWSLDYVAARLDDCRMRRDYTGQLYWLRRAHALAPGDQDINLDLRFIEQLLDQSREPEW